MPTLSRESNLYFDDLPTHISIFNSTQPHRKCIKRVAATHFCTITSTSIISKVSMKAQTLFSEVFPKLMRLFKVIAAHAINCLSRVRVALNARQQKVPSS